MRRLGFSIAASLISFSMVIPAACGAQSGPTPELGNEQPVSAKTKRMQGKAEPTNNLDRAASATIIESNSAPPETGRILASKLGVGVKMSLVGVGIEAATPITYHGNVRAGFNAFNYSHGFTNDGVNYNADLRFRSLEAHFDWFPFSGSFHLSPGLMAYNGNQIKANATVPSGQQFTLGGTTYTSDPANPISGTGKVGFNRVAPTFLLGWGNLVPRSPSHISVPFEIGIMFQGSPQATLNLTGTACDRRGLNCQNVTGDTSFENNVIAQQNKLNHDLSSFKVYPIISLGFGYKF